MGPWRHTAASVVAASAVLLTGQAAGAAATPAPVAQGARQGFRTATQIAADAYRDERRRILLAYRDDSRAAHHRLRAALMRAATPEERTTAWRRYADDTAPLRSRAHEQMQQARAAFRTAVEQARRQFGVAGQPTTYATVR